MGIIVTTVWAGMKMKGGIILPKGWRNFTYVKSMVIPDRNSGLYGFHDIFVNGKGLKALKSGGHYPDGTVFVGVFYDVATEKDGSMQQGNKLFTVVMRKNAIAQDTGGWQYGAFDPEGKLLEKDYKKECYECHTAAKEGDFIFSKFVD